MRLYPNSYHNIHKEPEYKARQNAEIYEWIHSRLEGEIKPPNFSKKDLNNLRFGRTVVKKSIKAKRFFITVALLNYLWFGFIVLVFRMILRIFNKKKGLSFGELLWSIVTWPKVMVNMMRVMSRVYYS